MALNCTLFSSLLIITFLTITNIIAKQCLLNSLTSPVTVSVQEPYAPSVVVTHHAQPSKRQSRKALISLYNTTSSASNTLIEDQPFIIKSQIGQLINYLVLIGTIILTWFQVLKLEHRSLNMSHIHNHESTGDTHILCFPEFQRGAKFQFKWLNI